jgi:hypothetical protein
MGRDISALLTWIRVVTYVAAVGTTAIPIVYSFSNWRTYVFGRLFMYKGISFAVAMNLSAFYQTFQPANIRILLWIDGIVVTALAITTTAMAITIFWMNILGKGEKNPHATQ